jgi:hypothetical protein
MRAEYFSDPNTSALRQFVAMLEDFSNFGDVDRIRS